MSNDLPASAAPEYVYGVAHVTNGRVDHYKPHPSRRQAENDQSNCEYDGADCYLVRCPVPAWEKVPDGE